MATTEILTEVQRFAVRHCFDEPSASEIDVLSATLSPDVYGRCRMPVGWEGARCDCTHTLCGRGSSRDATILRNESEGVMDELLRRMLPATYRGAYITCLRDARRWELNWRGSGYASELRCSPVVVEVLAAGAHVVLNRTPLASEVRKAALRLGKRLRVSLPTQNVDHRESITDEYTVTFGEWGAFKVAGETLEAWVKKLANRECGIPQVSDDDIATGLSSSSAAERLLAQLLIGANCRPTRAVRKPR